MRAFLPLCTALLLGAACSAPPPPVATVHVPDAPAPPVTASASAVAEPEPEPSEPEGPSCHELLTRVRDVPHDSVEHCDQIAGDVASIQSTCAPDTAYAEFAILEGAQCIHEVADDHFIQLKATLPAADAASQEKAHEAFEIQTHAFCTRGTCSMHYGAQCTAGLIRAEEALIEMAQGGEVELADAKPESKKLKGAFTDYAKTFCALPRKAWKGGAKPKACVERLLAALELSASGPALCDDE